MNNALENAIQATQVELDQLKIKIFNLRYQIKERRFLVQSNLMYYLTKSQYDYMNWYCEVLERRLKIMQDQMKKEQQMLIPS